MDFPGGPMVETMCFQSSGCREVRSLLRALRTHMPCSTAKTFLNIKFKKNFKCILRKKERNRLRDTKNKLVFTSAERDWERYKIGEGN